MLRKLQSKQSYNNLSQGFTLLELLLSLALIAILAGFSASIFLRIQTKNDLDSSAATVVQNLRRAQLLAQAVDSDIAWGVKIQNGSIILFKGASYATRDTAFDEISTIPNSIGASGVSEIVYNKFTGLPQLSGTITLSTNTDTSTVTINEKGTVSY